MEEKDFIEKLDKLKIKYDVLISYCEYINNFIDIQLENTYKDFHIFLRYKNQYERIIAYLLYEDTIYILVRKKKKKKKDKKIFFMIDINKFEIYETEIKMSDIYFKKHETKINSNKRPTLEQANNCINKYFYNQYVKSINYVNDEDDKYYKQNRLLMYIPYLEQSCSNNCIISQKSRFKYIIPLDIEKSGDKFILTIRTMFKPDGEKFKIMI